MKEEEYKRLVKESISSLEDTILMSKEWFANVWKFRKAIENNPMIALEQINRGLENMPRSLSLNKEQIKYGTMITFRFFATSIIYESKGITLEQWLKRNRLLFL